MTRDEAIKILTPLKWSPCVGFSSFDSIDNYVGEIIEGYIVVTQNRDSDTLTRSNWAVAQELVPEAQVYSFSHWLCGWVEHLVVSTGASDDVLVRAAKIVKDIQAYPILSDEHFSNLEYTEANEYWNKASMRLRIELCQHHGVSIFAARRDEMPETPTGELCTYN